VKLKKIIDEHDAMKKRRREFATQSLKNHLTILLISATVVYICKSQLGHNSTVTHGKKQLYQQV